MVEIRYPSRRGRYSPRTWWFDEAAVQEACDLLGVACPVVVKFTRGAHTRGSHRWYDTYHTVNLSSLWGWERASRVLWHELRHAAQCEAWQLSHDRGTMLWDTAYRLETRHRGYWDNRWEVEAREAEGWHALLPLMLPS